MACDLIPYPLLLKEKGDDCDAAPAGPSLSFRRGTEGEVAGHKHPRSREMCIRVWFKTPGFMPAPLPGLAFETPSKDVAVLRGYRDLYNWLSKFDRR